MNKTETLPYFSAAERLARLRLYRSDGIGPVFFRTLINRFGTAQAVLKADLRKPIQFADAGQCQRELDAVAKTGGHSFFLGDPDYPARLANTDDAPPVLHAYGNPDLLNDAQPALGIVGARNASASGIKLTRMLASAVADAGVIVISGLARGIDAAAHEAALKGGTIACVAGGMDIIYPRENAKLYAAIKESGLIVSEMPLGTEPQARHFPRRNRLISGLSDGVLVIEAAERSGSLITARFAAEQGRDVFAVPGSPLDPRAKGGNRLLKDGAILVQDAADILDELTLWSPDRQPAPQTFDFIAGTKPVTPPTALGTETVTQNASSSDDLVILLSHNPVHVDEIVRLSGLPTEAVLTRFLELEMAGKLIRHAGGKVSLT